MFEQAAYLYRWGLAGLALAGLGSQGPAALAGEKVTFSDSASKPSFRDDAKRNPGRSVSFDNPFESFGARGSSSLQGVTARPFAPSSAAAQPEAAPLTKRELDLFNERRNWILQAPDGGRLGETDANKAFGVEGFQSRPSVGAGSGLDSRKGDLVNYYEHLESTSGTGSAAHSPAAQRNEANRFSDSNLPAGDSGGAPANPFAGSSGFSALTPLGDSPYGRSPFAIPPTRTGEQPNNWLQNALRQITQSISKKAASQQDAGNLGGGAQPTDLSGMAMVLGQQPISSPIAASPITSLDPVSSYPDSTREALNPVVGQTTTPKASPLDPNFASEKMDKQLQFPTSAALQGLGANTFLAPSPAKTLDSPLVERRSLQSIKVQFDLPKRSF